MIGVGIGKSSQRDFLPAPYNDFIFAIIAEEYGIIGAMALIVLFSLILIRGVVFIARKAEDTLGSLLAVGCTLTIVLYGFVNASVASGLLPVTGLPMPFVSYGRDQYDVCRINGGTFYSISRNTTGTGGPSIMANPKVLIAAGGTGGHVYPAIAIADALKSENASAEVLFVRYQKSYRNGKRYLKQDMKS